MRGLGVLFHKRCYFRNICAPGSSLFFKAKQMKDAVTIRHKECQMVVYNVLIIAQRIRHGTGYIERRRQSKTYHAG
ncbi:hypothetical protein VQ7734_02340 [Vibrio quintilis]|uniref:Uncharacterized protein n=1 Tax=Vibrio quintilis TaxID=1117707 RepID=A0A1M7YVI1_9VIBR|nr:hypothetical protein VQ7734_02340 [Vibrio quintilis]